MSPEDARTFQAALLAAAVGVAVLGLFLKRRIGFKDGQPRSAQAARQGYILSFACSQSAAVMGIAIFTSTGWPSFWVFFAISGAALVLNFPQRVHFQPPRQL
jgi:hypothetical protein